MSNIKEEVVSKPVKPQKPSINVENRHQLEDLDELQRNKQSEYEAQLLELASKQKQIKYKEKHKAKAKGRPLRHSSNEKGNREKYVNNQVDDLKQYELSDSEDSAELYRKKLKEFGKVCEQASQTEDKEDQKGDIYGQQDFQDDDDLPRNRKPTQKEINECKGKIGKLLPNRSISRVIQLLYSNLVENKVLNPLRKERKHSSHTRKKKRWDEVPVVVMKNRKVEKQLNKVLQQQVPQGTTHEDQKAAEMYSDSQPSEEEELFEKPKESYSTSDQKLEIRQKIIKILCKEGFGVRYVRQAYDLKINKTQYIAAISTVIKRSIKKLQFMLENTYGKKINSFSKEDILKVFPMLCFYKDWLATDRQKLYFKLLYSTFKMTSIELNEVESVDLYSAISNKLRENDTEMAEPIEPQQLMNKQNCWTDKMQKEFCKVYLKHLKLGPVREYFQENYPEFRERFDSKCMSRKHETLVRRAIRTIMNLQWRKQFRNSPELKLTTKDIQTLISAKDSFNCKEALLQFLYLFFSENQETGTIGNSCMTEMIEDAAIQAIDSINQVLKRVQEERKFNLDTLENNREPEPRPRPKKIANDKVAGDMKSKLRTIFQELEEMQEPE